MTDNQVVKQTDGHIGRQINSKERQTGRQKQTGGEINRQVYNIDKQAQTDRSYIDGQICSYIDRGIDR